MISNSHNSRYLKISSFEDFRTEREMLDLRSKLIEAKLKLSFLQVRKMFSVSSLLLSVAREMVLPRISDFLSSLTSKVDKATPSGSEVNQT